MHLQIGLLELLSSTAASQVHCDPADRLKHEGETRVKVVVGTPRRAELKAAQAWSIIGLRCHDRHKLS